MHTDSTCTNLIEHKENCLDSKLTHWLYAVHIILLEPKLNYNCNHAVTNLFVLYFIYHYREAFISERISLQLTFKELGSLTSLKRLNCGNGTRSILDVIIFKHWGCESSLPTCVLSNNCNCDTDASDKACNMLNQIHHMNIITLNKATNQILLITLWAWWPAIDAGRLPFLIKSLTQFSSFICTNLTPGLTN